MNPLFPSRLGGFDQRTTPVLHTEVLVIGAGIAGTSAALAAAEAGSSVLLIAKTPFSETNTAWAQGGVAAVLTDVDSNELHVEDTLRVGAGLTSSDMAKRVIREGPEAVEWLAQLGAKFDRNDSGELALGREGGHSVHRVVHANGDATGAEIQRAIADAVTSHPRITCRVGTFVRDIIVQDGRCVGAELMNADGSALAVQADALVLAAGGAGQMYRETTNPIGACGDGVAQAFRAGAQLADMEFVQFHPTTLYIAGASRFLISEVVRGAGAVLRDRDGVRFMPEAHKDAELAPRDVVSRAILHRMVATDDTHVYLDLSGIEKDPHRAFPSISRICSSFDIDIAKDPIPVRPGAHYLIGGVLADVDGRSSIPGLFAVGEVAASGLHGANRLASNSLLEGCVLGRAAGRCAAREGSQQLLHHVDPAPEESGPTPRLHLDDMLYSLKSLMWRQVGLTRDAEGLNEALARIGLWHHYLRRGHHARREGIELTNMLTVSALCASAALAREESRGTHFRTDHPTRDDEKYCRRLLLERSESGEVSVTKGDLIEPSDQGLQ